MDPERGGEEKNREGGYPLFGGKREGKGEGSERSLRWGQEKAAGV